VKTTNIEGHNIHWQAIIFGKLYFFATDVEGTTYMLKVNTNGNLDIL
jgi:hypothetical protein